MTRGPALPGRGCVRALVVEGLRGTLPPDEPGVLRAVGALGWRLERRLRPDREARLRGAAAGLVSGGARAADALVREALDLDMQRRLEELVLPRVERFWLARYASVEGVEAHAGPTVFLDLGAPHPLLGVVALAAARPGLSALCPSPPPASRHAADRWLHRRWSAWRDALPVRWAPDLATAAADLAAGRSVYACLERGAGATPEAALAGASLAGRPLAEALAAFPDGTPVRAVLTHRERHKRWRLEVTPPLAPAEASARFAAHVGRWPGQLLPWAAAG